MEKGTTKVLEAGKPGKAREDVLITKADGKVRHRLVLTSKELEKPVKKVVARGTAEAPSVASNSVWDKIAAVRVRRQLAHQHRQRLLRRPAVQRGHVAQRGRPGPPARAQPRDADQVRQDPAGALRLGPVGLCPREVQLTQLRLLDAADVRRIAADIGFRPSKQRGQNFVVDANTVRRIVRTSGIGVDDVVVEVGPGLGSLTLGLLDVARHVVAVEVDPVLAARLPVTVAEQAPDHVDRLDLVEADAMRVESLPGPPPTTMVANLPYNVSVPVLLNFLEQFASHHVRPGDGAGRGGAPAGRRARLAHVRRAERQGGLVRRRPPRRHHQPLGVLAGSQRRLRPRRLEPATASRRRRAARDAPSTSSTPRSPSGARPCGRRSRVWPVRPLRPSRPWSRPVSTPACAVSSWTSAISPALRVPWPTRLNA